MSISLRIAPMVVLLLSVEQLVAQAPKLILSEGEDLAQVKKLYKAGDAELPTAARAMAEARRYNGV